MADDAPWLWSHVDTDVVRETPDGRRTIEPGTRHVFGGHSAHDMVLYPAQPGPLNHPVRMAWPSDAPRPTLHLAYAALRRKRLLRLWLAKYGEQHVWQFLRYRTALERVI